MVALAFIAPPGVGQIPRAPRPDEDFVIKQPLFASRSPEKELFVDPAFKPASPALSVGRSSLRIRAALTPISNAVSRGVIQIVSEFDRVSLGTIVSADGLVVAKYSELSKKFQCRLKNGQNVEGRLIGIHPTNDLALIQIMADDLTPVEFNLEHPAQAGGFVVSVGSNAAPVGFGLVTVSPQTFDVKQPACPDCIDLGAVVSASAVARQALIGGLQQNVSGLEVTRVVPRTPSERSGLLVGDLIKSINGVSLDSKSRLDEMTKSVRIGQTLEFAVLRGGKMIPLSTKIARLSPRTIHDRWGGGPFSERRFGFQKVIAHDSVLDPDHCGGPLVNLQGQVIGINISRSMRVASFAIPADAVYRFVKYVRPNAQLKLANLEIP